MLAYCPSIAGNNLPDAHAHAALDASSLTKNYVSHLANYHSII